MWKLNFFKLLPEDKLNLHVVKRLYLTHPGNHEVKNMQCDIDNKTYYFVLLLYIYKANVILFIYITYAYVLNKL